MISRCYLIVQFKFGSGRDPWDSILGTQNWNTRTLGTSWEWLRQSGVGMRLSRAGVYPPSPVEHSREGDSEEGQESPSLLWLQIFLHPEPHILSSDSLNTPKSFYQCPRSCKQRNNVPYKKAAPESAPPFSYLISWPPPWIAEDLGTVG